MPIRRHAIVWRVISWSRSVRKLTLSCWIGSPEDHSSDRGFSSSVTDCRLMSDLAVELSQTARMWGRAVAPLAEWVARTLWSTTRKPTGKVAPPSRLTQRHRREAKGAPTQPPSKPAPRRETICHGCGTNIRPGGINCARCAIGISKARLIDVARTGRVAARRPEARAKHAATSRRQTSACWQWDASTQPDWLTVEFYTEKIQPRLAEMSAGAIASRIGVSRWYAGRIRKGYRSHPRHWLALAELVGLPTP